MGSLRLPASGVVYADTQVFIYSVEKHPIYSPLLRPLWCDVQSGRVEMVSSELAMMDKPLVELAGREGFLPGGGSDDVDDFFLGAARAEPMPVAADHHRLPVPQRHDAGHQTQFWIFDFGFWIGRGGVRTWVFGLSSPVCPRAWARMRARRVAFRRAINF